MKQQNQVVIHINICKTKELFVHCLRFLSVKGRHQLHTFSISDTFISNARLKLAKNQANAKQHPGTELLLFENYAHLSST